MSGSSPAHSLTPAQVTAQLTSYDNLVRTAVEAGTVQEIMDELDDEMRDYYDLCGAQTGEALRAFKKPIFLHWFLRRFHENHNEADEEFLVNVASKLERMGTARPAAPTRTPSKPASAAPKLPPPAAPTRTPSKPASAAPKRPPPAPTPKTAIVSKPAYRAAPLPRLLPYSNAAANPPRPLATMQAKNSPNPPRPIKPAAAASPPSRSFREIEEEEQEEEDEEEMDVDEEIRAASGMDVDEDPRPLNKGKGREIEVIDLSSESDSDAPRKAPSKRPAPPAHVKLPSKRPAPVKPEPAAAGSSSSAAAFYDPPCHSCELWQRPCQKRGQSGACRACNQAKRRCDYSAPRAFKSKPRVETDDDNDDDADADPTTDAPILSPSDRFSRPAARKAFKAIRETAESRPSATKKPTRKRPAAAGPREPDAGLRAAVEALSERLDKVTKTAARWEALAARLEKMVEKAERGQAVAAWSGSEVPEDEAAEPAPALEPVTEQLVAATSAAEDQPADPASSPSASEPPPANPAVQLIGPTPINSQDAAAEIVQLKPTPPDPQPAEPEPAAAEPVPPSMPPPHQPSPPPTGPPKRGRGRPRTPVPGPPPPDAELEVPGIRTRSKSREPTPTPAALTVPGLQTRSQSRSPSPVGKKRKGDDESAGPSGSKKPRV